MPPAPPAIVFTDVGSVAGLLGASGLKLRLDDDGITTGSISSTASSTPIRVTTTGSHNLVSGSVVQISGIVGSGVTANGVWVVSVFSGTQFDLIGSVASNSSAGGTWTAIPQPESGWAVNATYTGTAKVNRYLQQMYDSADLALSWSVYNWATVLACQWLCSRRGNPIPSSLVMLLRETLDDLEMVRSGDMVIEDIALRNTLAPCWSNVRLDRSGYSIFKKLRVERSTSDRTRTNFPQKADLLDALASPYEINSP